ncbi:hypothetical protein [Absidia glauca]|uniref:Epidermal growth factor receptor-like transmembrane-juxtamembrane segment domain-containing protein n=1 Tax=Absidia glauca TaxID=4829 RepID=A0A163K7D5_ABSGL|nr:hypothetical protein [Absidia glauca]
MATFKKKGVPLLTHSSIDSGASPVNKGAIAGGVVGGVAGVALLGALIFFFLRRKRSQNKHQKQAADFEEAMNTGPTMMTSPYVPPSSPYQYESDFQGGAPAWSSNPTIHDVYQRNGPQTWSPRMEEGYPYYYEDGTTASGGGSPVLMPATESSNRHQVDYDYYYSQKPDDVVVQSTPSSPHPMRQDEPTDRAGNFSQASSDSGFPR